MNEHLVVGGAGGHLRLRLLDAGDHARERAEAAHAAHLVQLGAQIVEVEEAEAMAAKMAKGQFDLNDLRTQLNQMRRMGGLGALAGMIPGLKKAQVAAAQSGADDKTLVHFDAIMGSMTPKERAKPEILTAKRKIRIANGSGTTVQQVNKVLKMHQEMSSAMKKIRKMGGLKGLGALFGKGGGIPGMGGMGGGGGLPGLSGGGSIPPELANLMNKKK